MLCVLFALQVKLCKQNMEVCKVSKRIRLNPGLGRDCISLQIRERECVCVCVCVQVLYDWQDLMPSCAHGDFQLHSSQNSSQQRCSS